MKNETLNELKVEEVFARRLALADDIEEPQHARLSALFRATLASLEESE